MVLHSVNSLPDLLTMRTELGLSVVAVQHNVRKAL